MTLASISTRHRAIMDDLVLEGMRPRELSEKYDITESRLSVIRRSPLWVYEEAKLRDEKLSNQRKRMQDLVPKALDALEDTVQSNDEKVRVASAKEILSRGGLPANVEITQKTDLGPRELERAQTAIEQQMKAIEAELGIGDDDAIDAEVVDEFTESDTQTSETVSEDAGIPEEGSEEEQLLSGGQ